MNFKSLFSPAVIIAGAFLLQGCSTNAATGKRQFTALMSQAQEIQVGASEHENIVAQYGLYNNSAISGYVSEIGARVTQNTERPDVDYKFYTLDSPIVNAFALPGGYIYISRGLLALANSEAELAAVLAHEAGHITGRHSAERYSRSVVTSLGAGIVGAVIGSQVAAQALNTGANLYLSSYSRGQENESDSLGLRYMTQGGYDADEMSKFLSSLQARNGLEAKLDGRETQAGFNYFSTHPATGERVQKTNAEARAYSDGGRVNRDGYLRKINGLTYGDSAAQGFARGSQFIHPKIGFAFDVPDGFRLKNQPSAVVATAADNSVIVFDMAKRNSGQSASNYLKNEWMKDKDISVTPLKINGMAAAKTSFEGNVNGRAAILHLYAIEWSAGNFARFQMAASNNASSARQQSLDNAAKSLRRLSNAEKQQYSPYRVTVFTAKSGDTIASLAAKLPYADHAEERFRVLNALVPGERLIAGRLYKTISR